MGIEADLHRLPGDHLMCGGEVVVKIMCMICGFAWKLDKIHVTAKETEIFTSV